MSPRICCILPSSSMSENTSGQKPVLGSPLVVVAHDAGATNLIIHWLKAWFLSESQTDFKQSIRLCLAGPAISLWESQFGAFHNWTLAEALNGANQLLSGTGWASEWEYQARSLAKIQNIPTIAVLDHWVNYPERFVRDGVQILPDQLWVADPEAKNTALWNFPDTPVKEFPNAYLADQIAQIKALESQWPDRSDGLTRVLYLLEPIRAAWAGKESLGEFQALDYFVSKIQSLNLGPKIEISLRSHPSDAPNKYNSWCGRFAQYQISVDRFASLAEAIAWSDWVVGCETAALVCALGAGRKVISSLPPWAPPCRLPHKEILHLRELLGQTTE